MCSGVLRVVSPLLAGWQSVTINILLLFCSVLQIKIWQYNKEMFQAFLMNMFWYQKFLELKKKSWTGLQKKKKKKKRKEKDYANFMCRLKYPHPYCNTDHILASLQLLSVITVVNVGKEPTKEILLCVENSPAFSFAQWKKPFVVYR